MHNFFLKAMFVFWAYCLLSSALINFAFAHAPHSMTNFVMGLAAMI